MNEGFTGRDASGSTGYGTLAVIAASCVLEGGRLLWAKLVKCWNGERRSCLRLLFRMTPAKALEGLGMYEV